MSLGLFISASSWQCSLKEQTGSSTTTPSPNTCPVRCPGQPQGRMMSRREFTALAAVAGLSSVLAYPEVGVGCDDCDTIGLLRTIANRDFASAMETGMQVYEANMTTRKRKLFSMIPRGSVVADIGIGTGPNLAMMPSGCNVIGVEPNQYMWPYAEGKVHHSDVTLQLVNGYSENLPVPSASCDVVITTLTLCSVANVLDSLREIRRVVKPGGLFLFVEHVLAQPDRPLLRATQKTLSPLQQLLANGCHLDRDLESMIVSALSECTKDSAVERFDASFGSPLDDAISPIRPHISGFVRFNNSLV